MWGFSKLGMDPLDGMLFDAALKALGPQLSVTQFQNLNNVMIAAATLDRKLPETFLIQIAEQTILKMPQANAQASASRAFHAVEGVVRETSVVPSFLSRYPNF